jgi:pimeloyl-ACP methyl ester carboxylesterase
MIGQKDTTAIGKERAAPELAQRLGRYPELSRNAQQRIKNSTLISFEELGHAPQVQYPEQFDTILIEHLERM